MLTRRSYLGFLTLTRRNPTLRSSSRPNPGPTLWGPRGWVGLRKKCSTRPNGHTSYRVNLDAFSLKKLDENDEFMFNDVVVDNEFKNS